MFGLKQQYPRGGLSVGLPPYTTASGAFTKQTPVYANVSGTAPTGVAGDIKSTDGLRCGSHTS